MEASLARFLPSHREYVVGRASASVEKSKVSVDEICGYIPFRKISSVSFVVKFFEFSSPVIQTSSTLVAARRSATFSLTCFDLIRFGLIGFDFGFVSVSKRNGGSCPG